MKRTLVPFIKRQLLLDAEECENDTNLVPVNISEASTQTNEIYTPLTNPVQLFYEQASNLPNVTEIVNEVRLQAAQTHRQAMDRALTELTEQNKEVLESLSECLDAERKARKNENQMFSREMATLNEKNELLQHQISENLCIKCEKEVGARNDTEVERIRDDAERAHERVEILDKELLIAREETEKVVSQLEEATRIQKSQESDLQRMKKEILLYEQLIEQMKQQVAQMGAVNAMQRPRLEPSGAYSSISNVSSSVSSDNMEALERDFMEIEQYLRLEQSENYVSNLAVKAPLRFTTLHTQEASNNVVPKIPRERTPDRPPRTVESTKPPPVSVQPVHELDEVSSDSPESETEQHIGTFELVKEMAQNNRYPSVLHLEKGEEKVEEKQEVETNDFDDTADFDESSDEKVAPAPMEEPEEAKNPFDLEIEGFDLNQTEPATLNSKPKVQVTYEPSDSPAENEARLSDAFDDSIHFNF